MKLLTRIRLINWHLFENSTIDCQGTTYFIGVNGAGKSTILDAVQFALVGGQREVRFNQAALSGGKRTLASYVRGELGTEGKRYLRGDCTGVVALEFRNPDGSYFVHGAVIDAFQDNRSSEVIYFIVNNAALDDQWFFVLPKNGGPMESIYDTRAFRRHIEHYALPPAGRAQIFTRLEDYRFHLLNRLGQLNDSFPAKVVKGLAFSPLTDIRSFVQGYLLEENLVDVKTLQAQLETLRHFESLAADVRERIGALERICELDKERTANRRRRISNGYIARRSSGDVHMAELKNARLRLDETQLVLSRAELQRDDLEQRLRHAHAALLDVQVALQTNQAALREIELRQAAAGMEADLDGLRKQEAQARQILAQAVADGRRLREFLQEDGQPVPPQLNEFLRVASTAPGEIVDNQPSAIADQRAAIGGLLSGIEDLSAEYMRLQALLDERVYLARQEAESLECQITQLRTGDRETSYERAAPQAAHLRRLLRAELGLGVDQVVFLCSVLRIPDESWQDAIEGLLGRARFTLLVPPEHYDFAMMLYRQRRHKDGLHGVGLLDIERILAAVGGIARRPDSLAGEVETDHQAARAFVDLLLGKYVCCDTLEDLRLHRSAVNRECFVRRNYITSHLDPRFYRQWFIGERAAPRQIEAHQSRLGEIASEMVQLNRQAGALRQRLGLTRERVRPLIELEHALTGLECLPNLESRLAACQAELSALDLRSLDELRARQSRCQADVERLQAEIASVERQVGGLEIRTQVLRDETIPKLAGEIDQAMRDAEQFLRQENGGLDGLDDLFAEVGKEYHRRLERQPVETVRENASRYENDYQTAEARARDRLREAKQAYSLHYDFGYDNHEDASRYLGEHDKLIGSELPRYENQIAEQRALAEQELVENFIHRLREQIGDARQQLAYLNATLSHLRFGGERFEFFAQPAPTLRQVYDMLMDSQSVLGDSLFESDFRQKHQQGWDLLFERLTVNNDERGLAELRELQDYRNYLQYDIRIHYPNGDRALLSQVNTKKSGGETTTPFYVAMAASFAQAYRLNQPLLSDTIRLALFDEAFGKMDTARTASALQFMRDAGLQVLLATPPDKSGSLLPYVDTVCTVVRKNGNAFVIEIEKAEVMAELERLPELSRASQHDG